MKIDWAALYGFGLHVLRLNARDFWSLTPFELGLIAGVTPEGRDGFGRAWFEGLMAQFPDERT